jgi:nicotinate phosphoribosyltransferase
MTTPAASNHGDGAADQDDGSSPLASSSLPPLPMSSFVRPMLTDMYQITMVFAYWKQKRHEDRAVFELFFRKTPFHGEFGIMAGVDEVLKYLAHFRFTEEELTYLRKQIPHAEEEFFVWLGQLDCSAVKVYALPDGTTCFGKEPLIRVEGPRAIGQLLETTLLNLINYPSLIATNAARHRLAVGPDKGLFEFGLRRAQGPDGAMSAAKYSYLGGFDGTSNVLAGHLLGITISGTHAHAYVQSYVSLDNLQTPFLNGQNLVEKALTYRSALGFSESNLGEFAAFVAYAQSWPENFLCLVDTYDTLNSGVPNFLSVALALHDLGYAPRGIRLDSGDLAYLSKRIRAWFTEVASTLARPTFEKLRIVASNDINEDVLYALSKQGHSIDAFGVGTHLVTCQAQPALGCVYKLVEIDGQPRIKLSNEVEKVTLPSRKNLYRFFNEAGVALVDFMTKDGEAAPKPGQRLLCRHPFDSKKRAYVTPATIVPLLKLVWDGRAGGIQPGALRTLEESRAHVMGQLKGIREDVLRHINPTPYKVSVSEELHALLHQLWEINAPVGQL